MTPTTQDQVNQTAWDACDTFRGVVDAGQYKDCILVMLFLKYISDLWDGHVETYRQRYGGDEARIRRRLDRERFVLPESARFQTLYEQRNEPKIGELIDIALEDIEDRNRAVIGLPNAIQDQRALHHHRVGESRRTSRASLGRNPRGGGQRGRAQGLPFDGQRPGLPVS